MTPKATVAFEVYRDLGPARTLEQAGSLLGKGKWHLAKWSAKYEWGRLCAEYDHRELRDALGKREIMRERVIQDLVEMMGDAVGKLHSVMMDDSALPVLDRHGEHQRGPGNEDGTPGPLLYKPQIKASTQIEAAKAILGIAGLVPVKRTETVDRTGESLDAAAAVIRSMSPNQLTQLMEILDDDD